MQNVCTLIWILNYSSFRWTFMKVSVNFNLHVNNSEFPANSVINRILCKFLNNKTRTLKNHWSINLKLASTESFLCLVILTIYFWINNLNCVRRCWQSLSLTSSEYQAWSLFYIFSGILLFWLEDWRTSQRPLPVGKAVNILYYWK